MTLIPCLIERVYTHLLRSRNDLNRVRSFLKQLTVHALNGSPVSCRSPRLTFLLHPLMQNR